MTNPRDRGEDAVALAARAGDDTSPLASARLAVPAGATVARAVQLPLRPPGKRLRWEVPLSVSAAARGHRAELGARVGFWRALPVGAVVTPGQPPLGLQLPGTGAEIGADPRDRVELEKGSLSGLDDLSAIFGVAWSPEGLYLTCDVRDDRHLQSQPPEEMWRADSLQVALDYRAGAWRATAAGRPARWLEIGLALRHDGTPMACQWFPEPGPPPAGLKFAVRREGQVTRYAAFVPADPMGAKALATGDVIGIAAIVNDSDAGARDGWLQLYDGVGYSKDPRKYGLLLLGG